MQKQYKISIPSPCHENWAAMTPAEKGRFCGSCQKVVHDFTRLSDGEISVLLANEKNACGRFSKNQLNRELSIPQKKSKAWIAAVVAVVSMLGTGTVSVAQTTITTQQPPTIDDNKLLGEVTTPQISNIFTGQVTDSANTPMPGVNIVIRRTLTSTQTDFDGRYNIEADKGDKLEYSFVGMKTTILTAGEVAIINVRLEDDTDSMTTGIIITERSTENRSFFGRIFHSIANLFRKNE